MYITERVVDQVVILSLIGKFVFDSRKVFPQALQEAKKKSPQKIILNLEGLTYLDSAGLGLLAISFEQAKLDNIALCLVNPVGAVRGILNLTQFPQIMPVYETEEQALCLAPSMLASIT
jgi:anti-sigma B factor antagonist